MILLLYLFIASTTSIELTFELPDNAHQCFYEDIQAGIENVIEFQVNLT